jgi:hypothetical protein
MGTDVGKDHLATPVHRLKKKKEVCYFAHSSPGIVVGG